MECPLSHSWGHVSLLPPASRASGKAKDHDSRDCSNTSFKWLLLDVMVGYWTGVASSSVQLYCSRHKAPQSALVPTYICYVATLNIGRLDLSVYRCSTPFNQWSGARALLATTC